MLKDFETVKKQLKELSEVLNGFKSEAVQLRIIELLFKGTTVGSDVGEGDDEDKPSQVAPLRTTSRKKRSKKIKTGDPEKKSSAAKGRPGPLKTLEQLVTDNYFKSKKTIGEIVEYCKDDLTVTYKSTDLSGPLMKLVRDKKLKRVKNPTTNQYEYSNA